MPSCEKTYSLTTDIIKNTIKMTLIRTILTLTIIRSGSQSTMGHIEPMCANLRGQARRAHVAARFRTSDEPLFCYGWSNT